MQLLSKEGGDRKCWMGSHWQIISDNRRGAERNSQPFFPILLLIADSLTQCHKSFSSYKQQACITIYNVLTSSERPSKEGPRVILRYLQQNYTKDPQVFILGVKKSKCCCRWSQSSFYQNFWEACAPAGEGLIGFCAVATLSSGSRQ